MAPSKIQESLVGFVAECLVQAYAVLGSKGRLVGFRPAIDVDHKDWIVDEVGGYCNGYIQVKCAAHQDKEGRIRCFARYNLNAIPADDRFAYVFCLLDVSLMELTKIWVVPSKDFNRLAYRSLEARGRVELAFSCKVTGDPKWEPYEVDKWSLGPRLLELIKASVEPKAIKGLPLDNVLLLRGRRAKPSRVAA